MSVVIERATLSACTTARFTPGIGMIDPVVAVRLRDRGAGRISSWRADDAYWWLTNSIIAIRIGMKIRTIQAPSVNFTVGHDDEDDARQDRAEAVDEASPGPARTSAPCASGGPCRSATG